MKLSRLAVGGFKPGRGAEIDWSHPFARKLLFCLPFLGQSWRYTASGGEDLRSDQIWGSIRPAVVDYNSTTNSYSSNRDGVCISMGPSNILTVQADPIPAAQVTMCLIRRKHTSTNWVSSIANLGGFSTPSELYGVILRTDQIEWSFGGRSAPNALYGPTTLTFSTTIPEKWIFVAGSRGMAIWRDGVKIASTSTANPGRTLSPAKPFAIGSWTAGDNGDDQDINYFAAYDDQWDDALCRWWSAEPYAAFYKPLGQRGIVDFGAGGAAVSPFPALTVAI